MIIDKRGVRSDKVIRIYNGIEVERYSPALGDRDRIRTELGIDQDTVLIGAVGRLVWQKGFEFLIKSMPMVIKACPNSKVLIIGDGPLKTQLMVISEKLKVKDKIIFAGFRSDIREILSAIDIIAIPSLLEGFPMIILEAMAMAKPIIATRIDGITEQITDGETGLLVSSWDANGLAKAIIRLINDHNLAVRLGLKGRERVEKDFSVEKMIAETEKIYQLLL